MSVEEKEDVEKEGGTCQPVTAVASLPGNTSPLYTDRWTRKLLSYGVESRGTSFLYVFPLGYEIWL